MNQLGSPKWFYEKAQSKECIDLYNKTELLRKKFLDDFSPNKLKLMDGEELLEKVFGDNDSSMMKILMFDKDYRLFGAAGKYKYNAIIYKEDGKIWKYKENKNAIILSENEAQENAKKYVICY